MSAAFDFSELASVIAINSYTRNKAGVDAYGNRFADWMDALGYRCSRYNRKTIGDHLLFSSAQRDGRRLLLLGHLDTVFPEGSFNHFFEDDDWLYGPGVCDMKGGNHIVLEALRQVYQAQGEVANIDLLLVSDEEEGSEDSSALTSELAKGYDCCMVFEAAGEQGEVVIGRKGVGTWQIDIDGRAAHAGNHYQDGINANLAAARLLIELQGLTDVAAGSTVNVGKMSGGIGANTISPHASLIVEARYTTLTERDRLLKGIEECVSRAAVDGIETRLTGGIQRDVMEPDTAQAAFLLELEAMLGQPLKTERRGGVSDANIVAAAGIATIDGFGPFGDGDHTIHERASKQSFVDRLDQVTRILSAFNRQALSESAALAVWQE